MTKVTVIVPIYNADKYLEKCLQSIIGQSLCDMEIILVDDGSSDGSADICNKYALLDKRITVIHQDNKGLQAARTIGVKKARGEYIGFVDADDWIDSYMFEFLLNSVESCDIVTSGFWLDTDKGEMEGTISDLLPEGEYDADYIAHNYLFTMKKIENGYREAVVNAVWCKLFKTNIMKSLIDAINIGVSDAEDFYLTSMYILNCKRVRVTHETFYHYCVHSNSMTSSKNNEFLKGWTEIYCNLLNVINSRQEDDGLRARLQKYYMYVVYTLAEKKISGNNNQMIPRYLFPLEETIKNKRIILYGAGRVGISYFKGWKLKKKCEIIAWVDKSVDTEKNCCYQNVVAVNRIEEVDGYDYVVCATTKDEFADQMKKQLLELKVPEEKILYCKPINYIDEIFWGDTNETM